MTDTYWRDFWGSSWRRTNPYGSRDPIYTKGYHRGEDIGNNGGVANIPALRNGEIVATGRSNLIGYYIAVKPDADASKRDIYCHVFEPSAKRSGRVNAGDIIGRTAGWGENPGDGWKGPHLHFVISTNSWGGFDVKFSDYDPRPVITAALNASSSAAGGGSLPFDPKAIGEEMYIIRAPGRTPTLVGPGYATPLNAEEAANIGAIVSKDTTVNDRQFDLSVSAATRGTVNINLGAIRKAIWNDSKVDRGNAGKFDTIQELADAKTVAMRVESKTDQLLNRPAANLTEAQVKMIADAVIAAGSNVNYARIAEEVRAKFTEKPLK